MALCSGGGGLTFTTGAEVGNWQCYAPGDGTASWISLGGPDGPPPASGVFTTPAPAASCVWGTDTMSAGDTVTSNGFTYECASVGSQMGWLYQGPA